MAEQVPTGGPGLEDEGETRRDFLYLATGAMAAIGTAAAIWPFIAFMNPSKDVVALAVNEVDLSPVEKGQSITVIWQSKPVFVRRRTQVEVDAARAIDLGSLPDPQPDEARVKKPEWLVMIGICTHLGCIPLGQRPSDRKGDYGGWFCPCHGSHYDTSGRIRKGPAPLNLLVPPYEFIDATSIRIG